MEKFCPLTQTLGPSQPTVWYNEQIKQKSKDVRKAYDKAKKSSAPRDFQHYNKQKNEYKRLCKQTRLQSWKKFKEETNSITQTAFLVRLAQKEKKQDIYTLDKEDTSSSMPGEETIKILTNHHFPEASKINRLKYDCILTAKTTIIDSIFGEWINLSLIQAAIQKFLL